MRQNPNDDNAYRFRRRKDEGGVPWEECDRCGYPAPLAPFNLVDETVVPEGESPYLVCALCANIPATGPIDSEYETAAVARAICHAANAILCALGAFSEALPKPRL